MVLEIIILVLVITYNVLQYFFPRVFSRSLPTQRARKPTKVSVRKHNLPPDFNLEVEIDDVSVHIKRRGDK